MTFEHAIEIAAPAAELFDLSQDYARRLHWDPFLRSAELVGGAVAPGPGVRAYCVAHSGLGMETEYVSFRRPVVTAVKMTRGPWFLARFAGSWHFTELADGICRVSFRYHLLPWPRWLAWILTPLLRQVFARDTRHRLLALKAAAERGGAAVFRREAVYGRREKPGHAGQSGG